MSVKGKIKEAVGHAEEELFEHGDSEFAKKKAQDGRDLRNEGKLEQGERPKLTPVGSGHPDQDKKDWK